MSNFPLIKELQEPSEESKLPVGVKYTLFDVNVNNKNISVHIPLREAENFKNRIELDKKYTPRTFRMLIREFRGIRQK